MTRGGHVAEHEQLGTPRAARAVAQLQRHASGGERRAHGAAHVHGGGAPPATGLLALGGQALAQLRHHAVHGGQVLGGAGGQGAVELAQRLGRRQRLGALDQGPLQLTPDVTLELAQPLARHAVGVGQLGGGALALQAERAADPLNVHADHPGALALAPEGRDRQPRQVAQLAVAALLVAQRLADRLAQRVQVHPLGTPGGLLALGDAALHRLALDGAEEEAVEHQLQHAPVLLRLGQRGGERLAEVVAVGPAHRLQRGEGVEQLGGAHRHPLLAQLVGELEQPRRHARRARRLRHAPVELRVTRSGVRGGHP